MARTRPLPSKPIEAVQLGDRLAGVNPHRHEAELIEPDSPSWVKLSLAKLKRDGSRLWVELIRPEVWSLAQGAQVGGSIELSLPEFGAEGSAEVTALGPCPEIDTGQEAVVTGLFRHEVQRGEIIDLQTSDSSRAVRVTPAHRYWSAERQDFVEAGELRVGEHLSTVAGTATVVNVTRHPYSGLVYNLETTEHVYRVGNGGVLVHNACVWDVDNLSKSGASIKLQNGLARAGHAFEKPAAGQRLTSSRFPRLSGNVAAKNATAQHILDDILTDPGTIRTAVTGGNFKGGIRFTAPDGRRAVFDSNAVFQYFGE